MSSKPKITSDKIAAPNPSDPKILTHNNDENTEKKEYAEAQNRMADGDEDADENNKNNSSDDDAPLKYSKSDDLYDEQADNEDEKWMHQNYLSSSASPAATAAAAAPSPAVAAAATTTTAVSSELANNTNKKKKEVRKSDASLCCPGCFTPLCHESQRHERYFNQYRAVAVQNCVVDESRTVRPTSGDEDDDDEFVFHPLECGECGAEVGVRQQSKNQRQPQPNTDALVYHFFDAMPADI